MPSPLCLLLCFLTQHCTDKTVLALPCSPDQKSRSTARKMEIGESCLVLRNVVWNDLPSHCLDYAQCRISPKSTLSRDQKESILGILRKK